VKVVATVTSELMMTIYEATQHHIWEDCGLNIPSVRKLAVMRKCFKFHWNSRFIFVIDNSVAVQKLCHCFPVVE